MPNLPAYLYLIGPSRVPPGAERGHTGHQPGQAAALDTIRAVSPALRSR